MTGSGNFPPGRALRPEVRMNKEQEEAVRSSSAEPRFLNTSTRLPLLANPEARMAVANALLRHDRYQALSAPAAESGKDRQAFVDFAATVPAPEVTVLAGDPSSEPAPVAEAPERVTHERASRAIQSLPTLDVKPLLLRYVGQSERESSHYKAEASRLGELCRDLGREIASLRTQLTAAERKAEGLRVELEQAQRGVEHYKSEASRLGERCRDLDRKTEALQGENAEQMAHIQAVRELLRPDTGEALVECALRVRQQYELRGDKLAESERKLGLLADAGGMVYDQLMLWHGSDDWEPGDEQAASGWLVALRGAPASTEPAGVEAVWTQEELDAVEREATELHEKLGNTTPTETEAPARFRVGQRVRFRDSNTWAKTYTVRGTDSGDDTVLVLCDDNNQLQPGWVQADLLEPADPAPPKPGADLEGPPGSRSIPVYLSEDGQTLAFPGGGFATEGAMAEAKDEAGGRALVFERDTKQWTMVRMCDTDGMLDEEHSADAQDIVAALLANHEARMAVLEKMPEHVSAARIAKAAEEMAVAHDRSLTQMLLSRSQELHQYHGKLGDKLSNASLLACWQHVRDALRDAGVSLSLSGSVRLSEAALPDWEKRATEAEARLTEMTEREQRAGWAPLLPPPPQPKGET